MMMSTPFSTLFEASKAFQLRGKGKTICFACLLISSHSFLNVPCVERASQGSVPTSAKDQRWPWSIRGFSSKTRDVVDLVLQCPTNSEVKKCRVIKCPSVSLLEIKQLSEPRSMPFPRKRFEAQTVRCQGQGQLRGLLMVSRTYVPSLLGIAESCARCPVQSCSSPEFSDICGTKFGSRNPGTPIHSTAADFLAMQIGSLSLQSTEQPHACHVDVPLDEPPALWLMIKRSSPKHKRHVKNALKEMKLTEFLMENHFFLDEINEPRPLAHRADEVEQLWPIHVAAQLGDRELLRTLLRAGADSTQVSWFMKWGIKAKQSWIFYQHQSGFNNHTCQNKYLLLPTIGI